MGISKGAPGPPPGMYKDDPEDNRAETASMSSAMHLNDIEYPEEDTPLTTPLGGSAYSDDDLPAYTDVPQLPASSSSHLDAPISYLIQPTLPQSSISSNEISTSCHFARYSQDAAALEAMIREQAAYPPNFFLRLRGTHSETVQKRDNKTERKAVVDFDVKLNMTHLLVCPNPGHAVDPSPCNLHPTPRNERPTFPPQDIATPSCKYIEVLGATEKGFRGTVTKFSDPAPSDPEVHTTLSSWCDSYVSDPHSTKTFTLKRQITHHDSAALETLCKDLILRTSYRGHVNISFPSTHSAITLYSPSKLNSWRFNPWIYWPIYLTMLWIFTWPFLIFATKRYEVVTAVFPYRLDPERNRVARPLVQSEAAFFQDWKESLRRAVVSQHQGWIDGVYREETAIMVARGEPLTFAAYRGSLGGLVAGAVRVALGGQVGLGWGADS